MSDSLAQLAVVGFTVTVAALALSLLSLRRASSSVAIRRLDRVLLATFCMFLFVAWFFEPWVVYLCGWDGLESAACQRTLTGQLWLFYAKTFDPIFLNLPLWLCIVCSLDTILFGPFYAVSIYAFWTKQQEARWYELIALPVSGALLYSTVVYFAYEVIAEADRASLVWVFVINLPWTLAPVLLVARLGFLRSSREKQLRSPLPIQPWSTVTDAPFTAHVDESYFGAEDRGTYTGNVYNGRRHGYGRMVYGHSGDVYHGEWDHDLPHGMGTKCYGFDSEDGMYVGEWERGKQHGFGRMKYPDDDGHTYSGGWFQGRYAGAGTMMKHIFDENGWWIHDEKGVPKIVHVATGDWTSWTWTSGSWDGPYPREGGRGTIVTARKSTGPPAPRRTLSPAKRR